MKIEERFACIYQPLYYKDSVLAPDTVALVDYNTLTGNFKVKNGVYKGLSRKHFNIIKGSSSLMKTNGAKGYISRYMPADLFIYIFENRDINNIQSGLGDNSNRFMAYSYVTKKLFETALYPYDNKQFKLVYRTRPTPLDITSMLKDEAIYEQLYEEKMPFEDKIEDNTITADEGVMIYKVDINDGTLKQVNKNDLFDALPEFLKTDQTYLNNNSVNRPSGLDVANIINDISKKYVGQETAIKTLVTNIYYNQVLLDNLGECDLDELDGRKVNILLDGSTGTGKTAIVKTVTKKFDIPMVISSANSFSETGYVGPTITELLEKLYNQANGDLEKAERGIIVLDETDKLAATKSAGHNMKKGVQEELLSFISGGKYDIKVNKGEKITFDTSRITFILMGAFTDIRENKIKEKETNKIGFGDIENKDKTYTITPQDYIDYGLMREFFGRIKVIVSTNSYSKDDLTKILLNSEISPLINFEKTAKMYGYGGITYNKEFIQKVVDEAYKMNTGARALQTIMLGIQDDLLLEMITNNVYDDNKKIELSTDNLESYKKAKVIKY